MTQEEIIKQLGQVVMTPSSFSQISMIMYNSHVRYEEKMYKMINLLNLYLFRNLKEKTKYKIAEHFQCSYHDGYYSLEQVLNGSYSMQNEIRDVYSTQKQRTRKYYLQLRKL